MDVFRIEPDGSEDLVASGLRPLEVEELMDWFRYTKPLGRSVKMVARSIRKHDAPFMVTAAGTETEPPECECTTRPLLPPTRKLHGTAA